eukprot:COSAG06_NODE_60134_length_272_cov_0.531792_1_plen_39_part_01
MICVRGGERERERVGCSCMIMLSSESVFCDNDRARAGKG